MNQQAKARNNKFPSIFFAVLFIHMALPAVVFSQALIDDKPHISYIGNSNGQPVVQVILKNEQENNCKLILQDPEGNILYSSSFKEKSYHKKFLIDNPSQQNIELTVTIYQGKQKQKQVVKITNALITDVQFSVSKL
jgi:hypothetical protein